MEKTKAFLDRILAKIISRKLSVWLACLILTFMGMFDSGDFLAISLMYIGIQGFEDIVTKWRFGWDGVQQLMPIYPWGSHHHGLSEERPPPPNPEEDLDNAL